MSTLFDGVPLHPRNGRELNVLIIARISSKLQDRRSLGDQNALAEKYVTARFASHPISFRLIQGQGSGELLDRADLLEAEEAVDSRIYDMVVVEDIGRICRRSRAVDFCEACEDARTRLISINDNIDTAREDWRMHAFFASLKHESSNKDTSKRIRRSNRNRFMQGTIIKTFVYGYVKPLGAKTDADIYKDPNTIQVMEQIVQMLEAEASYAEVADWLNETKVPPSRWCKRPKWDASMVKNLVFNPILKGLRRWNQKISRRNNRTGRYVSEKAPEEEHLFREIPHLAFFKAERYDRLIDKLSLRGERYRNKKLAKSMGNAVAEACPTSRTVWPGQHVTCGVCGRHFVWGGHGPADNMICSGVRDYACWNVVSFNGRCAGPSLLAALWRTLEALPEFDTTLVGTLRASLLERRASRKERLRSLEGRLEQTVRELGNIADAIASVGMIPTMQAKMHDLELTRQQLLLDRIAVMAETDHDIELPSVDAIRLRARELLASQDFGDQPFGRSLRKLMPVIRVYPVQALDGGDVHQRAYVDMQLAPLVGTGASELAPYLRRSVAVNLFGLPQRIKHLPHILRRIAEGGKQRRIATELGIDQAAVQRGRALHRLMEAAGTTDPYVLLKSVPAGTKMRRMEHKRYEFKPLPGFPAWPE